MRTTLTIDDDIALKLKTEMRNGNGKSFKEVVNETLRRGLNAGGEPAITKPFKVRARSMGVRKGLNYDKISELLEQIEGSDFK